MALALHADVTLKIFIITAGVEWIAIKKRMAIQTRFLRFPVWIAMNYSCSGMLGVVWIATHFSMAIHSTLNSAEQMFCMAIQTRNLRNPVWIAMVFLMAIHATLRLFGNRNQLRDFSNFVKWESDGISLIPYDLFTDLFWFKMINANYMYFIICHLT